RVVDLRGDVNRCVVVGPGRVVHVQQRRKLFKPGVVGRMQVKMDRPTDKPSPDCAGERHGEGADYSASGMLGSNALTMMRWSGSLCRVSVGGSQVAGGLIVSA